MASASSPGGKRPLSVANTATSTPAPPRAAATKKARQVGGGDGTVALARSPSTAARQTAPSPLPPSSSPQVQMVRMATPPASPVPALSSPQKASSLPSSPRTLTTTDEKAATNKFKPSEIVARALEVGAWRATSSATGDIKAKFYYAKRQLVWECLLPSYGLTKMVVRLDNVTGFDVSTRTDPATGKDKSGSKKVTIITVEMNTAPDFFLGTPIPRQNTQWKRTQDFTGGFATNVLCHRVEFDTVLLTKPLNQLRISEPRLWELGLRQYVQSLPSNAQASPAVLNVPSARVMASSMAALPHVIPSPATLPSSPHASKDPPLPPPVPLEAHKVVLPVSVAPGFPPPPPPPDTASLKCDPEAGDPPSDNLVATTVELPPVPYESLPVADNHTHELLLHGKAHCVYRWYDPSIPKDGWNEKHTMGLHLSERLGENHRVDFEFELRYTRRKSAGTFVHATEKRLRGHFIIREGVMDRAFLHCEHELEEEERRPLHDDMFDLGLSWDDQDEAFHRERNVPNCMVLECPIFRAVATKIVRCIRVDVFGESFLLEFDDGGVYFPTQTPNKV